MRRPGVNPIEPRCRSSPEKFRGNNPLRHRAVEDIWKGEEPWVWEDALLGWDRMTGGSWRQTLEGLEGRENNVGGTRLRNGGG